MFVSNKEMPGQNQWMVHVKDTMKKHPGLKLSEVLKKAAATYKKKK